MNTALPILSGEYAGPWKYQRADIILGKDGQGACEA